MKPYFFFLAGMLLATLGSAQAGTYRWVDSSGKVHYGDQPAVEATQVEQKKFGSGHEPDDADLPFEARRARQNFPVTLYVSGSCGNPCQQARDLLNKRGIPYAEKNLATKEEIDAFKQMSGADGAPTLSVGRTWLKGFLAEQWNGELDVAGYPKTAPYRPQAPQPGKPAAK